MTFLKSALSRLSHNPTPVVATNISLDSWCRQHHTQPGRFIRKVEMCTALATGDDAWGTAVEKTHSHTLLRVTMDPASDGPSGSEDTLLIERVLSTGGAYHSVTPITEKFPTGGSLFHPDVHDRVCVIYDGPSAALARHLEVERAATFGDASGGSSQPHLTLAQFAQILEFVSRTTTMICAGGVCRFQSRSFAFTCLAALTPTLPPKAGGGVHVNAENGVEMMDDSVFELIAEAFLVQIPWLVHDPVSVQALRLIEVLKDGPGEGVSARLYH